MKKLIHLILASAIVCSCNQPVNEKEQTLADSAAANNAQAKQALGKGAGGAGTGGAGAATVALDLDCEYCKPGDKHEAPEGEAKLAIAAFARKYKDYVKNIGGTLILRDIPGGFRTAEIDKNLVDPWDVLKFHFCYDNGYLFLALDSAGQCVEETNSAGHYTPTQSTVENLFVSAKDNYIPINLVGESSETALTHLQTFNTLNTKKVSRLPIKDVQTFAANFNETDTLKHNYPCDFAYFSKAPVFDKIRTEINTNTFRYYFGYDDRDSSIHKIRVYLIGVHEKEDKNQYKNYLTGPGGTRIRETSRPKP